MRSARVIQLLTPKKALSQEVAMEEFWNKEGSSPPVVWPANVENGEAPRVERIPCWEADTYPQTRTH